MWQDETLLFFSCKGKMFCRASLGQDPFLQFYYLRSEYVPTTMYSSLLSSLSLNSLPLRLLVYEPGSWKFSVFLYLYAFFIYVSKPSIFTNLFSHNASPLTLKSFLFLQLQLNCFASSSLHLLLSFYFFLSKVHCFVARLLYSSIPPFPFSSNLYPYLSLALYVRPFVLQSIHSIVPLSFPSSFPYLTCPSVLLFFHLYVPLNIRPSDQLSLLKLSFNFKKFCRALQGERDMVKTQFQNFAYGCIIGNRS